MTWDVERESSPSVTGGAALSLELNGLYVAA